jgi:hypothetical protein
MHLKSWPLAQPRRGNQRWQICKCNQIGHWVNWFFFLSTCRPEVQLRRPVLSMEIRRHNQYSVSPFIMWEGWACSPGLTSHMSYNWTTGPIHSSHPFLWSIGLNCLRGKTSNLLEYNQKVGQYADQMTGQPQEFLEFGRDNWTWGHIIMSKLF